MLKEVLTLSGAANKILHSFNKGEAVFLFSEKQKDLFKLVRQQIVGGPSLVFSRHEKVGESIVGNCLVQSTVGYDANALYLYAIGVNIPTGPFTTYTRTEKGLLQPTRHTLQVLERKYVAYCTHKHMQDSPTCRVLSRFSAQVATIGKFVPDACCMSCKLVWEFLGCYYHAHDCVACLVSWYMDKIKLCGIRRVINLSVF